MGWIIWLNFETPSYLNVSNKPEHVFVGDVFASIAVVFYLTQTDSLIP